MIIASDLEWGQRGIDTMGLSWGDGQYATATLRTDQTFQQYLDILKRAKRVVGQNFISADCQQLAKEGVDTSWLVPKVYDTRLVFHALNAHLAGSGSFDIRSIVLLLGARQGKRFLLDWKQYEADLVETCRLDAAACGWAYPTLERRVKALHLEETVRISHLCEPIFAAMQAQGVRLDRQVLEQIYTARKVKTEQIVEQYHLWEYRGKKVIKKVPIWRSDKILDICQEQFGFRPKDRQRNTWLKLQNQPNLSPEARAFIEAIIDLSKGANDAHWLGAAEEQGDTLSFDKVDGDGFIYPRYDLCGSPDRAIASSPNIQNFPRPSEDPRPVPLRHAVIPSQDGHVILGVDFSSVEVVTNAYESKDSDRIRSVLEGRITHEGAAQMVNDAFGLHLNRQQGKAISHGFDKGESPYNLARTLFKTERPSRPQVQQCETIFRKMLADYPRTAQFREALWERARDNPLEVRNSFGRRLLCFSRAKYGEASERFAQHNPTKKYWCSCAECGPRRDRWKYAIAFLGRSSAFDALLRAMARIWHEKRLDAYSLPIVECHDELLFSVPVDKAPEYAKVVKTCFEEPIPELGGLSLPANAVIGNSWAEAH